MFTNIRWFMGSIYYPAHHSWA